MSEKKEAIQKSATRLRLTAFCQYETYVNPKHPFEDNLCDLLEEQVRLADVQRLARRVKYAGFPQMKTLDTFVLSEEHLPHLNFDEVRELATCSFIDEKNDVVAIGPVGRGKTHVAEYIRTLNRCPLLIIDEVGYLNYDIAASSLLFQVVSTRYEKASTFYTTNLAFSEWGTFIGDDMLASAIVDRIAHHAIILNMNGPKGWRLEHARSKQQRKPERVDEET